MRAVILSLLVGLAASVSAQTLKLEQYLLSNGMRVTLYQDHSLPVVAVNLWYSVGSKDEPERHSGFAHLFEHLMFMGTHRVPRGEIDKIMEAGGGDNNASTAEDRTNYYDWGPSNLLPTLLWLEADRLEDLGNSIDQKKLDLQRDVVKNERRQNVENTPYGKAYEALNGLLFPYGHPYHTSVIGSMQDLDNASVQDVKDFFATYYVPNNASLVVAGDFDPTKVKPMIERLFGNLPRRNDVPRKSVPDPRFSGVKRLTFVDAVQASKTIMSWHSPARFQPGDTELNVAASILSDGISGRLYQRLVVRDKLATDVSASVDGRLLGSVFTIDATASHGADLSRLEHAIDDEVSKLAKEGPTLDELARQASKLEYAVDAGLQSVNGTADQLNAFQFYLGRPDGYRSLLASYRSVTRESLRQAVATYLKQDGRVILRVVPETHVPKGANPRDSRPEVKTQTDFHPSMPVTFKLSNGLRVEFWQRPTVPLMELSLLLKSGSGSDPAGKGGLASLTAAMLSEGINGSTGDEFERRLNRLGGQFSASTDERSTHVSLSVLARNFQAALPLYRDAIRRPDFPAEAFERVKRLRLETIQEENDDPDLVASRVARREFFGGQHPLGRPVEGATSGVISVTRSDLRTEYSRLFVPTGSVLFVAGSLPLAGVKAALEHAFGSWKGGQSVPETAFQPRNPAPLRVVLVDRPGAVQTVIRFLMPSVPYSDPNRQALASLGTVLGGTFTSRLNQNLREDKGYTYGAGASFTFLPTLGFLSASADVRTEVTGASLFEFLKELRRLEGGDVTKAEALAVANTRRSEAISGLGTLTGLLVAAETYELNGRPFSDLGQELDKVSRVTADQMNGAAARGVQLDHAVIVLVGDKAQILKQMQGLGLPAPVEVKL